MRAGQVTSPAPRPTASSLALASPQNTNSRFAEQRDAEQRDESFRKGEMASATTAAVNADMARRASTLVGGAEGGGSSAEAAASAPKLGGWGKLKLARKVCAATGQSSSTMQKLSDGMKVVQERERRASQVSSRDACMHAHACMQRT